MKMSYCSKCKEVTPHDSKKVTDSDKGVLSYCLYCGNPEINKDGNNPVILKTPPVITPKGDAVKVNKGV